MQIGVITMDGRTIGIVDLSDGLPPDPFSMPLDSDIGDNAQFGPGIHATHQHWPTHEHRNSRHHYPTHRPTSHRDIADRSERHHHKHWPTREHRDDTGRGHWPGHRHGMGVRSLAEDRRSYAAEMQAHPETREQLKRVMMNEQGQHPIATQAVAESAMNRASVRGTSLADQLHWYDGRHGYYAKGNMGRGMSAQSSAHLDAAIDRALAGGNVSNLATDNASGGLAAREKANGTFRHRVDINGESFFVPGTAEKGLAKKYDAWSAGHHPAAPHPEAPHAKPDFDPETMAP